jgi:hypothetical protein
MDNEFITRVQDGRDLPPHRQILYALGQTLLHDSIHTGQAFCQFMLALSVGAIPVYLALIMLALPYDSDKGVINGLALLFPGGILLCAAVIFAIAYFPEAVHLTPDMLEHVEQLRLKIIRRRTRLIRLGFALFILGVAIAMLAIVKAHL